MAKHMTSRQARHLMDRIEREGAAIGLSAPAIIPETGPHPTKRGVDVVGHHYTVVATDTTTGERLEIPAGVTNYPDLATWRGAR